MPKAKRICLRPRAALSVGLCPCGSGRRFADCCGVYLSGGSQALGAPTPEALMRSRYSAYACGDDAYVLATWAGNAALKGSLSQGSPAEVDEA